MSGNIVLNTWVEMNYDVIITKSSGQQLIGKIRYISDGEIWITFKPRESIGEEDIIVLSAFSIESIERFDGSYW